MNTQTIRLRVLPEHDDDILVSHGGDSPSLLIDGTPDARDSTAGVPFEADVALDAEVVEREFTALSDEDRAALAHGRAHLRLARAINKGTATAGRLAFHTQMLDLTEQVLVRDPTPENGASLGKASFAVASTHKQFRLDNAEVEAAQNELRAAVATIQSFIDHAEPDGHAPAECGAPGCPGH